MQTVVDGQTHICYPVASLPATLLQDQVLLTHLAALLSALLLSSADRCGGLRVIAVKKAYQDTARDAALPVLSPHCDSTRRLMPVAAMTLSHSHPCAAYLVWNSRLTAESGLAPFSAVPDRRGGAGLRTPAREASRRLPSTGLAVHGHPGQGPGRC